MLKRKMDGDSMLFYEGDRQILTIDEKETPDGILMSLKGEVRSEVAYHIQDELDAFTTCKVKVTIDLKEVTFMAPSVLNSLLTSQLNVDFFREGGIVLRNIPDMIYQDMEDTGIIDNLFIEEE